MLAMTGKQKLIARLVNSTGPTLESRLQACHPPHCRQAGKRAAMRLLGALQVGPVCNDYHACIFSRAPEEV
jgi:hypothetical protein